MTIPARVASALALTVLLAACSGTDDGHPPEALSNEEAQLSFEAFRDSVYKEPFAGGVYVVNGDEVADDDAALWDIYARLHLKNALIVDRTNGADSKWSDAQKSNLSYCVSDTFGSRKAQVVQAMASATKAWSDAAGVAYVYRSDQDASCTASNTQVLFDVRPVSGQPYLARAFFPGQSRSTRNVLIDSSSFSSSAGVSLTGILRHELGHTLGFRHEHTRPEAGAASCYEDNAWRPLTTYDKASVMHYPQCNGLNTGLTLSALDIQGAQALYGPPLGSGSTGGSTSGSTGGSTGSTGGSTGSTGGGSTTGTPTTQKLSGTVGANQFASAPPFSVVPGTSFKVTMTGTGDGDLYVRFGSAPTQSQYACRPYLDGSVENCELTVPAGQTTAYARVFGMASSSTISLTVSYTKP